MVLLTTANNHNNNSSGSSNNNITLLTMATTHAWTKTKLFSVKLKQVFFVHYSFFPSFQSSLGARSSAVG